MSFPRPAPVPGTGKRVSAAGSGGGGAAANGHHAAAAAAGEADGAPLIDVADSHAHARPGSSGSWWGGSDGGGGATAGWRPGTGAAPVGDAPVPWPQQQHQQQHHHNPIHSQASWPQKQFQQQQKQQQQQQQQQHQQQQQQQQHDAWAGGLTPGARRLSGGSDWSPLALSPTGRPSDAASSEAGRAHALGLLGGGGGGLWEGPMGAIGPSAGGGDEFGPTGAPRASVDSSGAPRHSGFGALATLRCRAALEAAAALAESPRLPAPGAPTWSPRRAAGLAALAALCLAGLLSATPENLHSAVLWAQERPAAALALYTLLFTAGVVAMLPGMLFAIAAGAAFGFWAGAAVSFVSTVIGEPPPPAGRGRAGGAGVFEEAPAAGVVAAAPPPPPPPPPPRR
jgi:hypothetical protein